MAPGDKAPITSLGSKELDELERNFKSNILPHLSDKDPKDYDLVWQWQKFVFDKNQRGRAPRRT